LREITVLVKVSALSTGELETATMLFVVVGLIEAQVVNGALVTDNFSIMVSVCETASDDLDDTAYFRVGTLIVAALEISGFLELEAGEISLGGDIELGDIDIPLP